MGVHEIGLLVVVAHGGQGLAVFVVHIVVVVARLLLGFLGDPFTGDLQGYLFQLLGAALKSGVGAAPKIGLVRAHFGLGFVSKRGLLVLQVANCARALVLRRILSDWRFEAFGLLPVGLLAVLVVGDHGIGALLHPLVQTHVGAVLGAAGLLSAVFEVVDGQSRVLARWKLGVVRCKLVLGVAHGRA